MAKQTFTTGQVLTAAQQNSLQSNDFNQTVSVKTANYSLLAADKGTRIEFNTSGSVTCTVNSGQFDAGDTLIIQNRGAGTATITAGTATVNTSATLVVKQYDSGVLYFVSDSSAIYFASDAADTPLTTKGDLFTFSTAADRLAVGNNGDTLVADSAATTGLRWQGDYAAGKNKVINGDFGIWQRGTSFSVSGVWIYGADRFQSYMASGTATASQQTFTAGTAPVSGYEGTFFIRHTAPASGGVLHFRQSIENVRTFAGQTVTLSFWAKASTATTLNTYISQNFGSGGSATVNTTTQNNSVTTSWQRFTYTVTVGSVSGKTIGTSSFLDAYFITDANFTSSATLDIWGVQLEAGNVATAFQTATGTLQGELEACKRYYERCSYNSGEGAATTFPQSPAPTNNANLPEIMFYYTEKRINPTISVSNGTHFYCQGLNGGTAADTTGFGGTLEGTGKKSSNLFFNMTSWTATNLAFIQIKNSSGWIEASAEL